MRGASRTGPLLADVHANGSRGSAEVPIADSVKLKGKVNVFHPGLVNLHGCEVGKTHPVLGYKDSRHAPLPHSEACQDRTIPLPLYPQMTMADLEFVVSTLKKATEPK
jgi:dTDP-4-amino-4,6-dideoxygalactose transaminase